MADVQPPRYALQAGDASAAQMPQCCWARWREVNCSEGRPLLPRSAHRKKHRRSQEACARQQRCCCWAHGILNPLTAERSHWALTAQTGVHYAPIHSHCMEGFLLYRRRLGPTRRGEIKIVCVVANWAHPPSIKSTRQFLHFCILFIFSDIILVNFCFIYKIFFD